MGTRAALGRTHWGLGRTHWGLGRRRSRRRSWTRQGLLSDSWGFSSWPQHFGLCELGRQPALSEPELPVYKTRRFLRFIPEALSKLLTVQPETGKLIGAQLGLCDQDWAEGRWIGFSSPQGCPSPARLPLLALGPDPGRSLTRSEGEAGASDVPRLCSGLRTYCSTGSLVSAVTAFRSPGTVRHADWPWRPGSSYLEEGGRKPMAKETKRGWENISEGVSGTSQLVGS